MRPRTLVLAALLIHLAPGTRAQSPAPGQPVDLALVLAVDASGSVDQTRFELQKHGYAQAFRSREVIEAISAGTDHSIAVAMVLWTGPRLHVQVIPWTRIADVASAQALADAIDAGRRQLYGGGTSLSGAIDIGVTMLAASPFRGTRRVIDISGDGSNNAGRATETHATRRWSRASSSTACPSPGSSRASMPIIATASSVGQALSSSASTAMTISPMRSSINW
jgi:hypothetical protein